MTHEGARRASDYTTGVWPVLRADGVRTGHNVVIYRGGNARE